MAMPEGLHAPNGVTRLIAYGCPFVVKVIDGGGIIKAVHGNPDHGVGGVVSSGCIVRASQHVGVDVMNLGRDAAKMKFAMLHLSKSNRLLAAIAITISPTIKDKVFSNIIG